MLEGGHRGLIVEKEFLLFFKLHFILCLISFYIYKHNYGCFNQCLFKGMKSVVCRFVTFFALPQVIVLLLSAEVCQVAHHCYCPNYIDCCNFKNWQIIIGIQFSRKCWYVWVDCASINTHALYCYMLSCFHWGLVSPLQELVGFSAY